MLFWAFYEAVTFPHKFNFVCNPNSVRRYRQENIKVGGYEKN